MAKKLSIGSRRSILLRTAAVFAVATATVATAAIVDREALKHRESSSAQPAYRRVLSKEDQVLHALDRLTFGSRPGDAAALRRMGLNRWLGLQLNPRRLAEDPTLVDRLRPFESLHMSTRELYVHYPPPQLIVAVARGRAPLPDDPELQSIVTRLARRYAQRKQLTASAQAADPNNDSDLELRTRLTDIVSPKQIEILRTGKPEEKRAVLASIPASQRLDFIWALHKDQRQQLFAFAPVALRRELMLSVAPQNVVKSDLTEAKLLRAVYSTHQLEELLVDFWFNHFNVFIDKGADRYLVPSYENEAIRPYVLGKFYDMLLATAESPAMLFYLDNWQSVAPGSQAQNVQPKRGLNENYGRELLELHTLGVDGGYTQQDVVEVARCFTGWTIANPRRGGGFEFNDRVHDHGQKIVLGHVITAGGGMNDGLEVLNLLAHHPATAHFISLKLARRFVADNPPEQLVARMADTFLRKDGDIRAVMQTMLSSREFWSEGAYHAKIKTPFEMVVSAVRTTGADVQSSLLLANEVQRLGEPLYRKIEPTGYSSANAEWVSSASLLDRMNFAIALTANRLPGVSVDTAPWQVEAQKNPIGLARAILENNPSSATRLAIQKALSSDDLQKELTGAKAGPTQLSSLVAGLTIGSPDFQRH